MAQDINIKVGANISDLQKKMSAAQRTMERSGKKMSALGNDLMMSVSLPLAAFGGSIIMAAANFEKAMNGMKAVTAGGIESFDELNAKAKELGATTQFSATEAAEAMEMLGRNGLTATQILEGAADASLGLAAATGTDLSNAANIATDAMSQFNIAASDMGGVADLITGATVNSKFSIDDFQLAMASAGGVAGAVGVSFQDFATTISAISPSFASGSDAGTSLKTMLTTLNPKSKEAAGLMKQLGIITANGANQFFDAAGNMKSMSDISGVLSKAFTGLSDSQKINAAQTIFGTDAMRAGLKLAEVGSENFDKLATSIEGVSAAEVAGIRMEGFSGAVMMLKSAFETLQLAIADAGVLDFATRMVQNLTALSLSMAELNPEILKIGTGFLGLLILLGPMIKMVGITQLMFSTLTGNVSTVIRVFTKLQAATKLVAAGQLSLNVIMAANPVAVVVIAVVAFVAALYLLYQNVEVVRNAMDALFNNVLKPFFNLLVTLGKVIFEVFKSLFGSIVNVGKAVFSVFQTISSGIMTFLERIPVIGKVATFIQTAFKTAVEVVTKMFQYLPAVFAGVAAEAQSTGDKVKAYFENIALTAQIIALKVQKAMTLDDSARKALQNSIKKLAAQKTEIAKGGKAFGVAFKEAFNAEVDNMDTPNVGTVQSTTFSAGIDPDTEDDFDEPDFTGQTNMTTAVEKTTKAIKKQNVALKDNSLGLTELQPKQLLIATGAGVMTTSMNSMEQSMRTVKLRTEEMQAAMGSFNESLSNVLAEGVTNVAVGFGEVVGSMASGTASMSDMGSMLLGSLAGLLGQVGKLAVGTGVAMLGIKAALTNLHPAVAIAGGIALIALSKIVSSKAESLGGQMGGGVPAFAMGGLVDKPTLGVFGEAGPEVLIPKKRLDSLLSKHENGGGGNGTLEAMISGNDIKIVYDRAARRNSRVGG